MAWGVLAMAGVTPGFVSQRVRHQFVMRAMAAALGAVINVCL